VSPDADRCCQQRSGLPWHEHGETWLALLHGSKRWGLAPPGARIEPARRSVAQSAWEWLVARNRSDVADSGTITAVQRAGEVLYLPDWWQHQTLNLGEAVGLGLQMPGMAGTPALLEKDQVNTTACTSDV